jgi:hypothetical protein
MATTADWTAVMMIGDHVRIHRDAGEIAGPNIPEATGVARAASATSVPPASLKAVPWPARNSASNRHFYD